MFYIYSCLVPFVCKTISKSERVNGVKNKNEIGEENDDFPTWNFLK
jgi:hypothetical protein